MGLSGGTKKLAVSGAVVALYVSIMAATAGFAFGQYQIRIATALYAMAGVYPWLVVPLGVANMLGNLLLGGLGIFDVVGGLMVGIATSGCVALIRRVTDRVYLLVLPVALVPAFAVPVWLSAISELPYLTLVLSLLAGQAISAFSLGIVLLKIKWPSDKWFS